MGGAVWSTFRVAKTMEDPLGVPIFSPEERRYPGRASKLLAASLAALALGACGNDSAQATGAIVRDSAGVRIVEYAGTPDAEPPFAFPPEPVYRHGGGPGDYLFGTIRIGRLFPDGSAVISDAQNTEIVTLGRDGSQHTVIARSGQGPGDVVFVSAMFALGEDSLLVEDIVNGRFTLFVDGTVTHSVDTQGPVSNGLTAHGIDATGQMLMSSSSYRRGFQEEWLSGYMVRFDLDSQVADTIASFDWVPFRPPEGTPENPFSHFGLVAAVGGEFVYARTDIPELTWRRPDGTVRQTVRWQPEQVYPNDDHWDLFEAEQREILPRINPHAQTDEAIEELVRSVLEGYQLEPDEPLPLFSRPFGDDEGRLWLGQYTVPVRQGTALSYAVFSPDGEWLGRVDAPAGLRILDVAGGRVLGVLKDEMGVESVVVYELVGR